MREQLTRKDVERIQEEIDHRKLVVRKEAIEAVKEARAQGDLSENFEYYAAKKDKNKNESRIRYLERMLKTAKIISEDSRADEVGLLPDSLEKAPRPGKRQGVPSHMRDLQPFRRRKTQNFSL